MTKIEQAAIGEPILTLLEVEDAWDDPWDTSARQVKELCLSHERLRAELDAARNEIERLSIKVRVLESSP